MYSTDSVTDAEPVVVACTWGSIFTETSTSDLLRILERITVSVKYFIKIIYLYLVSKRPKLGSRKAASRNTFAAGGPSVRGFEKRLLLFGVCGEDFLAVDLHFDRERRANARAGDDRAANEAVRTRAVTRQVVDRVPAGIDEHRVRSGEFESGAQRGEVRDEFELASAVRCLQGKGPIGVAGEMHDHGRGSAGARTAIQKFLCGPGAREFFDCGDRPRGDGQRRGGRGWRRKGKRGRGYMRGGSGGRDASHATRPPNDCDDQNEDCGGCAGPDE